MTALLPAAAMLLAQGAATAPTGPVDVFRAGEAGYHTFRIPAVVRAADPAGGEPAAAAVLLAFAEGRRDGPADSGDVDLVLKRSHDGGATWGPLAVIADHGDGLFGNPAPVVDRRTGAVHLLVVRQPAGCDEADIRAGRAGERMPCALRSDDAGATWSAPRALPELRREGWRWYATGPCHGIQLAHGPHAGRLVVPANHSTSGGGADRFLAAHLILSDDGGATWRLGAVEASHVGGEAIHPSECTVAELRPDAAHPAGRLLWHTRDQHGTSPATRAGTWSHDGGATAVAPFAEVPDLVGPVCQGALLAVPGGLLYSGPSDPGARRRLALRGSADGAAWRELAVLHDGPAAYSDLVALGPGRAGCLFEADGYARIAFTAFATPELRAAGEGRRGEAR